MATVHIYGLSYSNMGDCTEQDADGYIDWLRAELIAAFPGHSFDFHTENSLKTVRVSSQNSIDEDDHLATCVAEFCQDAWNRCPWTWVEMN